jgi:hypothetical protein
METVDPRETESRAENLPARVAFLRKLNALPSSTPSRIERRPPKTTAFETLHELPTRENARREKDEPSRNISIQETPDPNSMPLPRTDKELPMCTRSRTDIDAEISAECARLALLPNLANARTDKLDPVFRKDKTLQLLPNLPKPRSEIEDAAEE